jgi:hypothetical protein
MREDIIVIAEIEFIDNTVPVEVDIEKVMTGIIGAPEIERPREVAAEAKDANIMIVEKEKREIKLKEKKNS